ncbi:MAG: hypothetical protein H0X30_15120 [Anaerolineae bacterium]|nr:hypothetical protein [Anaerolineae bacterium]
MCLIRVRTRNASGGRGLPRPHADLHPGAASVVLRVSAAHQALTAFE